jgi:hypothetical protein
VRSSHYINAQHWRQRLAFSLKRGYPVPLPHSRLARACQKNSLFTALNLMCTYWTYIAKVAIKYLYIVVDYLKSLQLIVFCVHTHAEI